MIKILELLEKSYPRPCTAGGLMKRVGLNNIDGEFSQIIRYLKETHKIIFVLVPENRMGIPTGRDKLFKWLIEIDEITINPAGIDFLAGIKKLEADENRNKLSLNSTIVLTQIAIVGIIFALYDKLNLNLSTGTSIPWLLSVFFWIILIAFFGLLLFKILNIIFNKESWRGILFVEK